MALFRNNISEWILKQPKKIRDIYFMVYSPTMYEYYSINDTMLIRSLGYADRTEFENNEDEYGIYLIDDIFKSRTRAEMPYFEPFKFVNGNLLNNVMYSKLDAYLFSNYGNKPLNMSMFPFLIGWDNTFDELSYVSNMIKQHLYTCLNANYYKWKNLVKSCMLEFNPLWNVDGVEETTRTLEQDGTIQNQKRGNDAVAHDESNQYKKTGTITDKKTGTETNLKSGTESTDVTNETVEENSGTDTETLSKTTTESSTWYDTEKSTKVNGLKTTTSNENDSLTTHNVTDRLTHDVTDLTTNNTTDTDTKDIDITTTYNNNDTMTRDLLDTERIILERHGNIGVTTTTKLLTEFREYVNIRVINIIAKDIANYIGEVVY